METLRYWTSYFNDTVEAAAEAAGVYFVDVEAVFDGHAPCGNPGEWINAVTAPYAVDPNNPFQTGDGSFHPKPEGHAAIADALRSFLLDDFLIEFNGRTRAGLPHNPAPAP